MYNRLYILLILSGILLNPGWLSGQIDDLNILPERINISELDVIEITELNPRVDVLSISPVQIEFHKTSPLASLLNEIPSVFIKSYGQVGLSTPSLRGTGAGHTQIFWNGIPVNSSMTGQTDLSLGAVGLFDGINVHFGSTSLDLGSGGLGGAIDLSNWGLFNYNGDGRRFELGQEVGSFGNFRSHLDGQFRKGKLWMSTQAMAITGQNDFTFRNIAQPGSPLDTLQHSQMGQLSLMQQIGIGSYEKGIIGRVWFNAADRDLPPTMLTNNLTESQNDRALKAQLEFRRYISDKWILVSTLSHSSEWLDYQNEQASISSNSRTLQNDLNVEFSPFKLKLPFNGNLNLGARAGYDVARSEGFAENLSRTRATVFAKLHMRKRKHQVDLLLRQSYQNEKLTLPYGYASYHYRINNLSRLHANLSRNYRFPTLNDQYWVPGGNPDLKTESSWTAEVGFDKWISKRSNVNDRELAIGTDFYASLIDNWIQWVPQQSNIWSPENVQLVFTKGGEVSLEWFQKTAEFFYRIKAGYALAISQGIEAQPGQTTALNKQLIYTPLHTGTVSFQGNYKRLNLYASQQFTSIRYTSSDHSTFLPGYHLGEIRGGYTFGKSTRLETYAGIRNLWNADYQAIAWRPMPGRNYYLGLKFQLKRKGL